MVNGLVTALDAARDAPRAALEVDEAYLGPISAAVAPRTITLMNLSHEFTRNLSYKREARHWRETAPGLSADCTVVANADDPNVAWSVQAAPSVVWVAGGLLWEEDARVCRGCVAPLEWSGGSLLLRQLRSHAAGAHVAARGRGDRRAPWQRRPRRAHARPRE